MSVGRRHVAVDVRMARDGGIGTYVRNVVSRVATARPSWHFTLLGSADTVAELGWNAWPNVSVRECRSPYYTIAEQVELAARCPGDADVFWAPHYNVPLFVSAPLVVTIHDVCHLALPEALGSSLARRYARFLFGHIGRRAASVLIDSEFSRAEMRRLGLSARGTTTVAPLAADDRWFDARASATRRPLPEPYLVYVGNWKRHKNVPMLLRAFGLVLDRLPHRLVLIGRREGLNADPAIAPEAERLGARCLFTGELSDDELQRWVVHADALVTASRYEGFGLPPLEAMACGVPCLVSSAGALPEVCGDAALYCDPSDVASVASGLVTIASDNAVRQHLIARGRTRARAFSWDRSAAVAAEALEHAIA
jgi:glycosyltransferase involved in cell wall biosynthesis